MAAPGMPSTCEPIINLLLVGSTGCGKSATGNTLLGHTIFRTKADARDQVRCEMFRAAITDGRKINVIDTPGIAQPYTCAEHVNNEIINCLHLAEEGIHAVLFVLSVRSCLAQEEVESTLQTLLLMFGNKVLDYFVVVFTGGDEMEEENETLDNYLHEYCPEIITRILRLCRGRKVLFDNMTKDKGKKAVQINQLLTHVADIRTQNCGIPYTEKLHRQKKEWDDKLMEQVMEINAKNLADIALMKEKIKMEHERTMNKIMMSHIVESALKQSAESQKKEMHQLKDTLKLEDTETINVVAQMLENALKNDTTANEVAMYSLKRRLQRINTETLNTMEMMVENALKLCEATHQKEMHQLKNTLQLNDSQTMNMMVQMSAATHEREKHQLSKNTFPRLGPVECNIM